MPLANLVAGAPTNSVGIQGFDVKGANQNWANGFDTSTHDWTISCNKKQVIESVNANLTESKF